MYTVINSNGSRTNTTPEIAGGATAGISVAENRTSVTTVTATDADNDTITYRLSGGADQAKFSIDETSGALTFISAPNYENPTDDDTNNDYEVEVTADDSNGGTDAQTLTVNVTDVNEYVPPAPEPEAEPEPDDDSDDDGIPDDEEGTADSDGDGTPDAQDDDSDNDGTPDAEEGMADTDGDGTPDSQDSDDDNDGIPSAEEIQVPTLGGQDGETGDGNGDGIPDTRQDDVSSLTFRETDRVSQEPDAPQTFVSLVADSDQGQEDTDDDNQAVLTSVQQLDAPDDLPEEFQAPLGLISFIADVENSGETETFSLYVDDEIAVNGYFKQDSSGTWVNLASAEYGGQIVTEEGRTRLDFVITDGGEFDDDGVADGIITDPGIIGYISSDINNDSIDDAAQPQEILVHQADDEDTLALAVSPADTTTELSQLIALSSAEAPSVPTTMNTPHGLFSFTAQTTTDTADTESSHFELYLSDASAINGIWAQRNDGLYVNLATQTYDMEAGPEMV